MKMYFHLYFLFDQYKLITLPSTSPINAGISFEQKLKEWQIIKLI